MPRKKKKQQITIQSTETKIVFGLILFIIGLAIFISPFASNQTVLFDRITLIFGYASIVWGIFIIYLSLFLLLKSKKFVSIKQAIGLFLLSISTNTLLSFWQIEEQLNDPEALRVAGGQVGKAIHLGMNNFTGSLIEILIVLLVLIVSFSLITGTTLEQILDFLEDSVPEKDEGKKEGLLSQIKSFTKRMQDGEEGGDDFKVMTGEQEDFKIANGGDTDTEDDGDEQLELTNNIQPISINHEDFLKEAKEKTDGEDVEPQQPKYTDWTFPSIEILQEAEIRKQDESVYRSKAKVIEKTLASFGIQATVVEVAVGPTVLRFSLSVTVGVKVSKIKNLSNDLALALASRSSSVRIEAPIPGTSYVGIEIPNPTPNFVYTRDMIKRLQKEKNKYELPLIIGKDITAKTCIRDLAKIPHLLVAGATGTGKSVALNALLTGLLMTKSPDEVKFLMIDPKMGVEMAIYNGIPHLLNPVITDTDAVSNALQWCIEEMMRRYRQLKQVKAKKLTEYNAKLGYLAMPYIVIVVDEMADLMLTSGIEVETKIQRLAQMGRAVGVHLILATQKPTVNVITGLIKSNIPGRMAFAVATNMDSRVILDEGGAETLLGNGDMLYKDQTTPKALRIQGTYATTEDSEKVIDAIKAQVKEEEIEYSEDLTEAIEKGDIETTTSGGSQRDPEFEQALHVVVSTQKASSSYLQRKMKIGYNKAARLIDQLYDAGAIGPENGSKPRDVLLTSMDQIKKDDASTEEVVE